MGEGSSLPLLALRLEQIHRGWSSELVYAITAMM